MPPLPWSERRYIAVRSLQEAIGRKLIGNLGDAGSPLPLPVGSTRSGPDCIHTCMMFRHCRLHACMRENRVRGSQEYRFQKRACTSTLLELSLCGSYTCKRPRSPIENQVHRDPWATHDRIPTKNRPQNLTYAQLTLPHLPPRVQHLLTCGDDVDRGG